MGRRGGKPLGIAQSFSPCELRILAHGEQTLDPCARANVPTSVCASAASRRARHLAEPSHVAAASRLESKLPMPRARLGLRFRLSSMSTARDGSFPP